MRFSSSLARLLTAVCSITTLANAHSRSRQALDYFTIVDSPSINTPGHRVHYKSEFEVTFSLHRNQQKVRLTLEPNHDIIPPNTYVTYLDDSGNVRSHEEIVRSDHRVFKGSSWVESDVKGHWNYAGWARVFLHQDGEHPLFEGAFELGHDSHHIQLRSSYASTKHGEDPDLERGERDYMVVWRDSDISAPAQDQAQQPLLAGGYDHFVDSYAFDLAKRQSVTPEQRDVTVRSDAGSWGILNTRTLFGKRQSIDGAGTSGNQGTVNLRSSIGSTAGCPRTKKVALLGIATDCTYTATFGTGQSAQDATQKNAIAQLNMASALYETSFNITLALANVTVNTDVCPGTPLPATPWNVPCSDLDVTNRLNVFSQWRGKQTGANAFWTLLSNCPTGSEVGLSWTGALCQQTVASNNGTSANVVVKTSTEWQVLAHEIGHTFGAVHDCDSDTCKDSNIVNGQQCCPVSSSSCDAGGQFIMNPSISSNTVNKFSPCTIGNICSAMSVNSVNASCLVDNNKVPVVTEAQCGNGVVEEGEDCDCGGTTSCGNNACCDPTTCKFKTGAVCDDDNQACCKSCQFASSGTVCRASTGVCDPQETCPGNSGSCPSDQTAPNGQDCGNGMQCASGQCTSRDLQCKQLMGTSFTNGNNDTTACDQTSCVISCAAPEFGTGTCFSMNHNFLDGTVCGGDGRCSNGQCQGSTAGGQISSWIEQNKPLVIGLAAGIGGLIVLSILCCIISACRRRRRGYARPSKNTGGWNGPPPSGFGGRGQPQWQDPGQQFWSGHTYDQPVPQQMSQPAPYGGLGRHQSVRYA